MAESVQGALRLSRSFRQNFLEEALIERSPLTNPEREKVVTMAIMRYTAPVAPSLLVLLAAEALVPWVAAAPRDFLNPSVEQLCDDYRFGVALQDVFGRLPGRQKAEGEAFIRRIVHACDFYSVEALHGSSRPAFNFRATALLPEGESACRIFRSGQPALPKASEESPAAFPDNLFNYDLPLARRSLGVDTVVALRFDPHYRDFTATFGLGVPSLPIAPCESSYRYAVEKKMVEDSGMASVFAPTLPEFEHFLSHYVPRLERGPGSKPYVCRLPRGIADGAKPHWLTEHPDTPEQVAAIERSGAQPLLASAFEDCRDWAKVYGKDKVAAWLAEVKKAAEFSNHLFILIADAVRAVSASGRKVLYHCGGGTDRAGRVSMIIEMKEYGVTRDDIRAYSAP